MIRLLFLTRPHTQWNPDDSLELSLIEEAMRRSIECYWTAEPNEPQIKPVLFAEKESPCFIGFGLKVPRLSIEKLSQIHISQKNERFQILIQKDGEAMLEVTSVNELLGNWPKTSSQAVIAEIESWILNDRS